MRSDVSRTMIGALFRQPVFALRATPRAAKGEAWWSQTGSNRRPHACKARALPTELWPRWFPDQMVGPGRVERPTSRLSGVRSNHLSYEPDEVLS